MSIFKEYIEPTMTVARVQSVIEAALAEQEYGADFDTDAAARAVECYLAHGACWDDLLEAFQAQLDAGFGPDDGKELSAYQRTQNLAGAVTVELNREASAQYGEDIDKDALLELIKRVKPALLEEVDSDVSEEDFVDMWTNILCACIVGGISYAEEEFMNYTDMVGADRETIIAILRADQQS